MRYYWYTEEPVRARACASSRRLTIFSADVRATLGQEPCDVCWPESPFRRSLRQKIILGQKLLTSWHHWSHMDVAQNMLPSLLRNTNSIPANLRIDRATLTLLDTEPKLLLLGLLNGKGEKTDLGDTLIPIPGSIGSGMRHVSTPNSINRISTSEEIGRFGRVKPFMSWSV